MKPDSPVHTIDVAHPPMRPEDVERFLRESVAKVRNSSGQSILKIVHGYGRSGRGGSTKEVVRNWLYRMRALHNGVIPGEEYTGFHEIVQKLRSQVGHYHDPDLTTPNPGITVVWIRK